MPAMEKNAKKICPSRPLRFIFPSFAESGATVPLGKRLPEFVAYPGFACMNDKQDVMMYTQVKLVIARQPHFRGVPTPIAPGLSQKRSGHTRPTAAVLFSSAERWRTGQS